MNEGRLLHWLQRFLSGDGHTAAPFEGLSEAEEITARQLEKEFRKTDSLRQYSNAFLQTLESTERFSEIAIRALSALTKIGWLGETVRDVNVFCRQIAEIFTQELGFENCSILLKHPSAASLRLTAGSTRGDKYEQTGKEKKKFRMVIYDDIALQVASTGEHIFIPDVSQDKRCSGLPGGKTGISSLLSVPVRNGTDLIGVINCSHPIPGAFDENRINLIILLSNFVGQIITLITLHNKISAWNEALQDEVQKKTLELRSKNAKLHKLAVTDSLTNLYNRRFFFTRLEEELSRTLRYNEEFALLSIDLDNLKAINDAHGHLKGDKALQSIARCLKNSVRKGDVVGRLGGDEFGYIMIGADEEVAFHFALRLQESLSKIMFEGIENRPTMSIGIVAVKSDRFKKYQDVYKAADSALYAAKKKKNSIIVFGRTSKIKGQGSKDK